MLAGSRLLGTLPLDTLPQTGDHIVFAARRWQVKHVDPDRQEIMVQPARRRKRPTFVSRGGAIHERVIDRMLKILGDDAAIPYLDGSARDALASARSVAKAHRLAERRWISINPKTTVWLTWTGTVETATYQALLASVGVEARSEVIGLICTCSGTDLSAIIRRWSKSPPDLLTLAEHVWPKHRRKYDEYLPGELLDEGIASVLQWVNPVAER